MPNDGNGESADADPTAIASIAVTVDDVVTALETNRRTDRRIVLRVTPPFSRRMRARLHRPDESESDAVRLDPEKLVVDPPPYPDPDETADRLRTRGTYTTDRHHERHTDAVREWRFAVREGVVESVELDAPDGPHGVEVKPLG